MGAILSLFRRKPEREAISNTSCVPCQNAVYNNARGLFTGIYIVIILMLMFVESDKKNKVLYIASMFGVCNLFAPVPVGACGLMPIFLYPIFGLLDSATTCAALINENIMFFFVGGWLLMLLNNCGMDKRLVLSFLTCGSEDAFTAQKLLLKSCMAAFFVSALCNRELVTQIIMKNVLAVLDPVSRNANECKYGEVKTIICNAVAISATLGSLCIMHSALTTIQMRAIFCDASDVMMEFPDVFNFLNYSAFAVPVALLMFLINLGIQIFLLSQYADAKKMSKYSCDVVKKDLLKKRKDLGPVSCHEKVSTLFLVALLICYFTRWSKWLNMGWATFRQYAGSTDLCGLKDATTASIFVILLHFLPKTLNFTKIFSVSKQREKPVMKVESGILFWRFIDKNTDYSLFILFGAGIIIYRAIALWKVDEMFADLFGNSITEKPWNLGIFIVVACTVFMANIMTGLGLQAVQMPFCLAMAMHGHNKWPQRMYLVALAVGLGSALGFCFPSRNSPTIYVKTEAKIKCKRQAFYSFLTVVVCTIILWLALCFYAPVLWDPDDIGILTQPRPLTASQAASTTTTAAPEAAAAEPAAEPEAL